ncbi:tyrosine-type recombinase/integrase (plasmid) [Dyella sp. BiH032]|uniref:tyrosine-type recombinase/integrase n=1 Tax=Dyella sp. BiH032 TaxID=3075430 RepID=UPI00289302C3|nr:tyrosine-type recombinase/integrase [Dyella sp. BiH032]WNL48528.1 tyrosine-type recombinase/integrase [Dyella sp. BiH032]
MILRDALTAMLATCDDGLAGVRDRALLLFAFASGGRRRSEIAAARLEDLRQLEHEGEVVYLFGMAGAKRQEPGQVRHKPLRGSAAAALRAWLRVLEARGLARGPLFRAVKGATWIGQGRLSGHAVNAIVKRRAELAGLPGNLTAHGLRGGFLTQAYRDGVDLFDAMALSDHRDVKTVREHYLEDFEALRNPAGLLLDR